MIGLPGGLLTPHGARRRRDCAAIAHWRRPQLTRDTWNRPRARCVVGAAMELVGRDGELAAAARAVEEARRGRRARARRSSARPGSARARCWPRSPSARATRPAGDRGARRRARARRAVRPRPHGDAAPCGRPAAGGDRCGGARLRRPVVRVRARRGPGRALPPAPRRPRAARAARPPAPARAAARRPALGRRGLDRARAAPAAPPAGRRRTCSRSRRGRPARRRGCSTRCAARPAASSSTLGPLGHDASLALLARRRPTRRCASGWRARRPATRCSCASSRARADRPATAQLPPTLIAAVEQEVAALPRRARARWSRAPPSRATRSTPSSPRPPPASSPTRPRSTASSSPASCAPTGQGRAFAFRHPLVRRAVYDRAAARLAARRPRARGRRARAPRRGRRRCAPTTSSAPRTSGDEAAIALLVRGRRRRRPTPSPADAAHWYAGALRLVPRRRPRAARRAARRRWRSRSTRGRPLEEARDALLEALAHPGRAGSVVLTRRCTPARETLLGRHAEARRRLLAARERRAARGAARRSRFELAMVAFNTGRGEDLRALDRRRPCARPSGGRRAGRAGRAPRRSPRSGALWDGDPDGAAAALDRATAIARRPRRRALGEACALGAARWSAWRRTSASASPRRRRRRARSLALMRRARPRARGSSRCSACARCRALALLDLDEALQRRRRRRGGRAAAARRRTCCTSRCGCARSCTTLRGETAEVDRAARECAAPDRRARAEQALAHRRLRPRAISARRATRERAIARDAGRRRPRPRARRPDVAQLAAAAAGARRASPPGALDDAERWARDRRRAHRGACGCRPARRARACARAEVLLARGDAAAAAALAARGGRDGRARRRAARRARGAPAGRPRARRRRRRRARPRRALQRVAADAARGGALRLRDAAARELRRLGSRVSADGRRAARGRATPS